MSIITTRTIFIVNMPINILVAHQKDNDIRISLLPNLIYFNFLTIKVQYLIIN
jgi:hypothetical protein